MGALWRLIAGFVGLMGVAGLAAGQPSPEVKDVLDKAIAATGGRESAGKFRTFSWKGKADFEAGGQQISLKTEGSSEGLAKYRLELNAQVNGTGQELVAVLNGDKVWATVGGKTTEIKPKDAAPIRAFLHGLRVVHMLPALGGKDYRLSHLGELKVGQRPAVGLSVSRKGQPDVSLFFDKKDGLPIKSVVRLSSPDGQEKEVAFLFTDYKDFDGIKHASKITIKIDTIEAVLELSDVRAGEDLDASLFGKPE